MSPSTPIRLVALDLDGTLLDSKSQISPRTRQAIADAVGRGVIVLPCTGRPLASLPPLVAQLPGIRYAITTNGAAVWDMGTDPLGAVYSRYADAARRQTHQPVRLHLPVSSAEGGAVLIHQCSRTRAPRFLACFAGRPLAIRTRKTNAAFGVACFSFVLDTLYPRWLLTSTKLLVQYRKFC